MACTRRGEPQIEHPHGPKSDPDMVVACRSLTGRNRKVAAAPRAVVAATPTIPLVAVSNAKAVNSYAGRLTGSALYLRQLPMVKPHDHHEVLLPSQSVDCVFLRTIVSATALPPTAAIRWEPACASRITRPTA